LHYCVMASIIWHDTVNLLWIVICYLHCAYVQRESETKCVGVNSHTPYACTCLYRRVVSNGENVNLEVQRVNGSQLRVTVSFSTRTEQLVTVSNQLTFDPALAGTHFTATSGTLTIQPRRGTEPTDMQSIQHIDYLC